VRKEGQRSSGRCAESLQKRHSKHFFSAQTLAEEKRLTLILKRLLVFISTVSKRIWKKHLIVNLPLLLIIIRTGN